VNGAKNAGILAAQIIGASDRTTRNKIIDYKAALQKEVEEKSEMVKKG